MYAQSPEKLRDECNALKGGIGVWSVNTPSFRNPSQKGLAALGILGPKSLHIDGRKFGIIDSCFLRHSKVTSPKLFGGVAYENHSRSIKSVY